MRRILKVAQREYIATVRTKAFLFGVFVGPLLSIGIIFFAGKTENMTGPKPTITMAVTDLTGQLSGQIKDRISKHNNDKPDNMIIYRDFSLTGSIDEIYEEGKSILKEGGLDAHFVITPEVIDGDTKIEMYTYKTRPAKMNVIWKSMEIIKDVVIDERCKQRNLSRRELGKVWSVNFDEFDTGAGMADEQVDKTSIVTNMMLPFAMMFLIYIGIIGMGQHIISSVIEEKNSRIIEVLLSAVSPFELLSGKILGLVAAGLTVVGIWCLGALAMMNFKNISLDLTVNFAVIFILYYVLGFMFFSALLAAIGSVCNTLKETQSLMFPVIMILIVPMISWYQLSQSPNGTYARVLSMIPMTSPLVMVLRLSSTNNVASYEVFLSLAFLAAGVYVAFLLAGKIFATGILMYGKRPGISEVLRWVRGK